MKAQDVTITVTNRLEELGKISEALDSLPPTRRCSARKRCEINLSIEELFTNIVTHGIDDTREHEIRIRFSWTDTELTIRIEDDGKPFNPITMAVPDTDCCLANRCIGGLGIHLVRHFMDAVNYMRKRGKNIMTLKKSLAEQESGKAQETPVHCRSCDPPDTPTET
jgi:anti-sigma regulatory factor (Ser/Thr protein kinase)